MKALIYSPKSAVAILLAGVILRQRPGLEVEEQTDSSIDDLLEQLKEIYPVDFNKIQSSQALIILDEEHISEHVDGQALAAGIICLHHDITDFPTQQTLKHILFAEEGKLEQVIAEGNIIIKAVQAPVFLDIVKDKYSSPVEEPETTGANNEKKDPDTEPITDDQKASAQAPAADDTTSVSANSANLNETVANSAVNTTEAQPQDETSTADVNPEIKGKEEYTSNNFQGEPAATDDQHDHSGEPALNEQDILEENHETAAELDANGPVAKSADQPERQPEPDHDKAEAEQEEAKEKQKEI
jgi:hypothetical protein